jgi:hypothetical protein
MNKPPARATAAERVLPQYDPSGTPAGIVCAALALAVLVLIVRIAATTW